MEIAGIVIRTEEYNRETYYCAISQTMNFLSSDGLKHLLFSTRSPNAHKLACMCNIKLDTKYESKEASTLQVLEKAFRGEYILFQHVVGKYRIDMYFPEYNLAIECDENDHNHRDPLYEKYREKYLVKQLKCEFIRYNPDADDFDVISVINQVFQHIKKCVQDV